MAATDRPTPTGGETEAVEEVEGDLADVPVRVSVASGAVWASDDEVFWGSGCLRSIPPQCGRELRIEGFDADELAALPGGESRRAGDDGPLITWLDGPGVRLMADYDRVAGTLTLVAPPEPMTLEEASDNFERQQHLGAHRPDPPCEPTGTWDGPTPDDLDRPDIQGWLDEVNGYTADADGFVHRWYADGWVLVVQFTDAAGHRERLAEIYSGPLCVEQVDYTADALNAASSAIFDAREQLRDDGVLWLSQRINHRGLDVLVFLADDHSRAAIQKLVDPDIAEHIHVMGVAQPETGQQATSTTVAELGRTVAVVQPGGGGTRIELHQPDGTTSTIELPSADPSEAWWFVDAEGGVVWQASDAGSPAVVRTTVDGDTTLVEAVTDDTAERYQLVGLEAGGARVLVEHRTGGDPDDMTADLLAVPLDGSGPEMLATEVGGWESGILHAAADPQSRLYGVSSEASQFAVLDRPDGTRTTVYEAGEPTGEYLRGVAITAAGTGLVLVETAAGYPDLPRSRLLVVDLTTGRTTDEIDVPLKSGDDMWSVPTELSISGDHVLVNRYAGQGDWLTPLVLDLATRQWAVLDVTGRTRLGPAAVSFVSFDPDRGGVLASEPRPDAALGTAMVATDPEQLAELWQTFALTGEPPALDLTRFVVIGTYLDVTVCPDRVDLGPVDQGYTQSRDSDGRLERVVLGVGRDIDCQGDTTRRAVIYAFPDPAPELSITAPQTELDVTIP